MIDKKGIQNHIFVLFGVSFAMSFFLIFVLTGVFRADPELCENVNFEVTNTCKSDGLYFITIQNNDKLKSLNFLVNGRSDSSFVVPISTSKVFRWEREDNYILLPYIRGEDDGECRGKRYNVDSKIIVGLCK